ERMVVGLWRFLGSRGRFGELEKLLGAAAGCAPPGSMLEARLLFARGDLSTEEDPARAQALLTRALEIFRRVGGEVDAAMALLWLGTALAHQGDIEGARSLWREALPTFERLEEDTCASICLSYLSITTTQASEAELLLARAIELSRRSDIILVLAQHLVNLNVFVATTYGDYARSLGLLEEAIQLERDELSRPYRLADLHCRAALDLINLGEFARAQRQLELATQLLAERESWEAHAQYGGAGGLWAHAWLHFARGEVEAA